MVIHLWLTWIVFATYLLWKSFTDSRKNYFRGFGGVFRLQVNVNVLVLRKLSSFPPFMINLLIYPKLFPVFFVSLLLKPSLLGDKSLHFTLRSAAQCRDWRIQ